MIGGQISTRGYGGIDSSVRKHKNEFTAEYAEPAEVKIKSKSKIQDRRQKKNSFLILD